MTQAPPAREGLLACTSPPGGGAAQRLLTTAVPLTQTFSLVSGPQHAHIGWTSLVQDRLLPLPIGSTKHQSPYATSYWPAFLSIRHRVGGTQSAAPASPPRLPPHCLELWTPTGPTAEATAAHRGGAARGSRDSPIRCPTGELNGFPRRKSIAAATAATSSQNQVTATAGAADPSRDPPASPRGGAGRRGLRSAATGPRPLLGYPSAVADATPGRGLGGRAPSHAPEASAR